MKKLLIPIILAFSLFFTAFAYADSEKALSFAERGLKALKTGKVIAARDNFLYATIEAQNSLPFAINRVVICKEVHDYDNFVPLGSNVLPSGNLLLYIEPANAKINILEGKKYEIWISEDVVLRNSNGNVIYEKKKWLNLHQRSTMPPLVTFLRNSITGIPSGKYTIELTVNDMLTKKFVTKSIKFTVK